MPVEPDVLLALSEALESDPDNVGLAVHLAELELEAGQERAALEHARTALARRPADVAALRVGAGAAQRLGEDEAAAGYRALIDALGAADALAAGDGDSDGDLAQVIPLRAIPGRAGDGPAERPTVTLADVGGLEEVKQRLDAAFLAPMRNPRVRAMYGKPLKGGLLLYGPPGCGKTFLARAVAGEMGARFIGIGIADVLDMWHGESERRLRELFAEARRSAPCVLFLDEVDAIGHKRAHLRGSAGRTLVNQLLAELDGQQADNEGVFVLAATNHPWDVDTALRRPGRLDRTLLVLPPDDDAREVIVRATLAGRPVDDRVDPRRLVKRTDLFSGADLAYVCELATEHAMADALRGGEARPITMADLDAAVGEVQPSTLAWFDVAYNYAAFANEGGTYDELLTYIRAKHLR